jgi:hypothetical protein
LKYYTSFRALFFVELPPVNANFPDLGGLSAAFKAQRLIKRRRAAMSVVLEREIGNAIVRIRDDYCKGKTPEDAQKILRRIADYVQGEAVAAMKGKAYNETPRE